MAIRIKTRKVWQGNVKCREILDIDALPGCDGLNEEYRSGTMCFINPEGLFVLWEENGPTTPGHRYNSPWWVIQFKGDHPFIERSESARRYTRIITESEFQELLRLVRIAGDRLHKINEKIRASWSGKETIEI